LALIDLIALSKSYESNQILKEIDFSIHEGERGAIIGKNGGGKSTLLKIIQGVLDFDEGRRVVEQNLNIQML